MRFGTYEDLMKELISFYDDVDVIDSGYSVPLTHQKRIFHYINRAQEEIWYYRPWPWRMATYDFSVGTPANGRALLPLNFSNVGPNGLLIGPGEHRPWVEISYQDMVVLRRSALRTKDHLFCIGDDNKQWDADAPANTGTTGVYSGARYLLVPDTSQDFTGFELLYEMTAPTVTYDVRTQAIGVPAGFHHALMVGSVAKVQEGKGDARSVWRSDFVATLAKLAAELEALQSRPRQMPVTIGRMW
jgi:hypothetical protein